MRRIAANIAKLPVPLSGTYPVDRCDAYGHFAVKCAELARTTDSPRNRSIMLQMALVWLRLWWATSSDGYGGGLNGRATIRA